MTSSTTSRSQIAAVALLASGCTIFWDPGADPRGRELIANGNTLVASLEAFRADHGHYPSSLQELPATPELGRPGSDYYLEYRPEGNTYRLGLTYTPSWPQAGKVDCTFDAGDPDWGCG